MRRDLRGVYLALAMAGLSCASAFVTSCGKYDSVEITVKAQETSRSQDEGGGPGVKKSDSQTAETGSQIKAETMESTENSSSASAPVSEFETVDETVYVKTGDGGQVRLRSSCSTADDSNIVGKLDYGTELKRTGKGEQWSQVIFNGATGYISTEFLSAEKPEPMAQSNSSGLEEGEIKLDSSWKYADFSKINSGAAKLYRSTAANRKNKTVCVNAGHGTQGGGSVKTQCHPDGTPKVTGGTTSAGATTAAAVSGGMTFADGTPEYKVTVALARLLKDKLLAEGYDVVMIREGDDVQLDNIARTVIANNTSDCHIALHWDSTESNKGAFYMSVPSNSSYRAMEPVKSHWEQHNALGESLVGGLKSAGVKIFSSGSMEMDLTQTSFSTIPSIDIELGDKKSDHSEGTLSVLADGLTLGVKQYFGYNSQGGES